MITLSSVFKTAIANGGPMKYLINISEDNGVSWQTLPEGAEIFNPLDTISGETELEPFQFVGPDIEITAFNRDGYWTNSAKTGKLDTGNAVKLRIKEAPQSITNEWVQLIEGYVDLSSVARYRTEFTCTFTVRGQLNVLDSVFANFVLADRSAKFPHKFGGWLEIVSVDGAHPEGLFELRFDADEQKISWDNGPGQSINTSAVLYLKGQTGNQIAVRNMCSGTDATALPQTSGTISQWVAVKNIQSPDTGVYFKAALQPNTCMTLQKLKEAIYKHIDLNLDGVESIPIKRPDANIINYNGDFVNFYFTRMQPVHVVGIDANRWLISLDGGVLTGNFILTVTDTPYFKVQSFARFDPTNLGSNAIIVNSYINTATNTLHLLVEYTPTRQNTYHNTITSWKVFVYIINTMEFLWSNSGLYEIFYRSFAGNYEGGQFCYYLALKTNSATHNTDIYRIVTNISAFVYQKKTNATFLPGNSLVPGIIVMGKFYVCATAFPDTTDNKVKIYLQIWDIENSLNYANKLTEIEFDYNPLSYWQMGPSSLARKNSLNGLGEYCEGAGMYLLIAPINYNSIYVNKLTSTKNSLYEIMITTALQEYNVYGGVAKNPDPTHISDGQTLTFYTDRILGTITGKTIEWTSGANIGQKRIIASKSEFVSSADNNIYTIITMDTALPYGIRGGKWPPETPAGDMFKIYTLASSLQYATYNYKDTNLNVNFIKNSRTTPPDGIAADNESGMSFDNDNEMLYKNVPGGYPLAGDYNSNGTRILIATQDNLQIIDLNQAGGTDTTPNQYPEVALADFEDKTLRQATQEVVISANCFIMPSEHNKRLSLIYRGKAVTPQFSIANTQYTEGPRATPYYDYEAVELNGKKAGAFVAGGRQRDISLTTQTTPDAYSQSLANDILKHIGSGDRTHEIRAVGRIELEPGDPGYLELENGTTKKIRILGHNTNPETLERNFIIREE